MRFLSIASSSSGNCIYVGDENTHILIDAGISGKRIEEGLKKAGICAKDLDAVFITHEHTDHISGLKVLSRKADIPIYATAGTLQGIQTSKTIGGLDSDLLVPIKRNENISIGNLIVKAIPISHDAADPVCYKIYSEKKCMAVATDMGCYNEEIVKELSGLDAILLESNHDIHMLQAGPYPYPLKLRILGDRGHLSNEAAGQLLSKIIHDDMKYIRLGHLSEKNNMPQLAHEAVRLEVTLSDNPYQASDFDIEVADRAVPGNILEF